MERKETDEKRHRVALAKSDWIEERVTGDREGMGKRKGESERTREEKKRRGKSDVFGEYGISTRNGRAAVVCFVLREGCSRERE